MIPLELYLENQRALIDQVLAGFIERQSDTPSILLEAMSYSLQGGGKRLRPILALAAGEATRGDPEIILPAACALELIHTYSLIHDDLPAMDNDDFRRGKPTSHKVFGEATAILAGDALLTMAFQVLSSEGLAERVNPKALLQVICELALASGSAGMIGGQVMDVMSEGKSITPAALESIHTRKTGALIRASVRIGALLSEAPPAELRALTRFGEHLGLGFQIADDVLDVIGEEKALGKRTGGDARQKKATYPALLGLETAKSLAHEQIEQASAALSTMGPSAQHLRELASYVGLRIDLGGRT